MLDWQKHKNLRLTIRIICVILIVTFLSYDLSWAGATEVLSFNNLASLSHSPFVPPTLKYLSVNEANPHNYFNFLLDKGQLSVTDKGTLNKEARQLINYFFLGITLPDDVFWVNLKPAESNRITSEQLSRTDLGRTLLEQDFRLKRDMSQYLNPQNPVGRQFWGKLYSVLGKDKVKKAAITTSNRVWIVPAEAVVVETDDGALLAKSSLKVLLESEYATLKLKPSAQTLTELSSANNDNLQALTEQLMKEIIIPAITKDVNESQNYAPLRQIYHSLILAQWFKRKHKNADSVYAQAINKGNLNGLESQVPWKKQQIWQEYLKSYKQGEYKIQDTIFGLKRMYFSGGVLFDLGAASAPLTIISQKELPELLKQNPDLLNPDSLKDSLVVITERQGNQENLQEQSLVQDINVVSALGNLAKETPIQQAEREKPELQESKLAAAASSPSSFNLKNKLKKFFITAAFTCIILFSHVQPVFAHHFTLGSQGKPQAVVEIWNKNTPAENTLGGISRDILIAEGKKATPQALYGKDGLVNKISRENQITNPNSLKPNQQISISDLSSTAQERLIRAQENISKAQKQIAPVQATIERLKNAQNDLGNKTKTIEDKNQALENEVSALKERLKGIEGRVKQIEEKTGAFDKYARNWWEGLGTGWKTILYILAALGIGAGILRFGLYRSWQRLRQLRAEVAQKEEARLRLDNQIETQKQVLLSLNAQVADTKISLAEAEKKQQAQDVEFQKANEELKRLRGDLARPQPPEDITQQIERIMRDVEQLQNNLKAKKEEFSLLVREEEAKLASLKASVSQLEREQAQYEEVVRGLKDKISEYQIVLSALEGQKNKANQELTALDDVASARSQLEELDRRLQEAQESQRQLEQIIGRLEDKKRDLEAGLSTQEVQKSKLESDIVVLSERTQGLQQKIIELQAQKDALTQKEQNLLDEIEAKTKQLKQIEEQIASLEAKNISGDTQLADLTKQKNNLETDIAKLSQYISELSSDAKTAKAQNDALKTSLAQLDADIAGLNTQKARLNQEIEEASSQKQQEVQEIDRLNRQREEINQKVILARQQLDELNIQIQGYSGTLEEIKQRGVSLNKEIPALTRRRDSLQEELAALEKSKQELGASITQAKQDTQRIKPEIPQPIVLPKPYTLMIFDVDNTLTDVTTGINQDLLTLLLDFLSQNIRIALVTAQSMDEVKRYIIEQVPQDKIQLLSGLTVYPSGGAKCYSFNSQGQAINGSDYDATIGLTMTVKPNEVEEAIRRVVGNSAGIGLRDGLITITGLSNQQKAFGELITLFKEEGWHYVPRLAGRHTIHVLIGGVDKGKAATHFVKELGVKTFGQEIPHQQVLVIGDSFSAGGLDADLISALPNADIVSVGKKPQGKQLRDLNAKGIFFSEDLVSTRNWQATLIILREVRKGNNIAYIRKNTPNQRGFNRGLSNLLLILSILGSLFFPSAISNAQVFSTQHGYSSQISQPSQPMDNSVEVLTRAFTLKNYEEDISKIDKAIKTIQNNKISHPKAIEALKWVLSIAKTSDGKFYVPTTKNAAVALLDLNSNEAVTALAKMLKDPTVFENNMRLKAAIEAITEIKPQHPLIYESLEWLAFKAYSGKKTYNPSVIKLATSALIQLGDKGISRLVDSFNLENYHSYISEIIGVLKESGVRNPGLMEKMNWLVLDVVSSQGGYYPHISKAAFSLVYDVEGDKAINKLVEALNSKESRKWQGAAKALMGIAEEKDSGVTEEIIIALKRLKTLGNDYPTQLEAIEILKRTIINKIISINSSMEYQNNPRELRLMISLINEEGINGKEVIKALASLVLEPNAKGNYYPDINKSAVDNLIRIGDIGISALCDLFTPHNYKIKPAQLQLIVDSFSANKINNSEVKDKFLWAFKYKNPNGSRNNALRISLINAFSKLGMHSAIDMLVAGLSDTHEEIRKATVRALVNLRVPQAQIESLFNSDDPLAKESAKEILRIIAPNRLDELMQPKQVTPFSSPDQIVQYNPAANTSLPKAITLTNVSIGVSQLFFHSGFHEAAQSLRDRYKDSPWIEKIPNYLLSYIADAQIWIAIGLGIIALITGIVFYVRGQKVRAIYRQLLTYVGESSRKEKRWLKKASINLAKKTDYDVDDVYRAIAEKLPEVYEITKNIRIEKIAKFLDKLNQAKVDSSQVLRYGVPFMAHIAKDEDEFDKGLNLLADVAVEFQKQNINISSVFGYNLEQIKDLVKDFSLFEGVCGFFIELAKTKQNPRGIFNIVVEILKTKDSSLAIRRLNVIPQLMSEGIQPTVFLVEVAEKTKDALQAFRDTAKEVKKQGFDFNSIFYSVFSAANGFTDDPKVVKAACNLIVELSKQRQNPQEILTNVAPEALRKAKDANTKVARLNIILQLLLEGIHPTQLLIETLEKTTSQSSLTSQLTQWSALIKDFKSGAVKFDINNPIHVDLEYTTFRELTSQVSQSNTYENYRNLIQQFRSYTGSPSGLPSQDQAEIKLAVYEAYRMLEFIIAVKNNADKLGRPVWVVPNLSYGKFAVGPILDELGKLNIEVHYARVGSTESHEYQAYTVRSLFNENSENAYSRILKERPILIVVDGTQHTDPRLAEGKSSRYPDAYVGYRNFIIAVNEAITERKNDKFLEDVHIDKGDSLSELHQNDEYKVLVATLDKLNSGLDQPGLLYKMGFWSPATREFVRREGIELDENGVRKIRKQASEGGHHERKEVEKIPPFNPDHLDSPALIFINSPLADEDLPQDIRQWAGLEQAHKPAYFDDRSQIKQTMIAVNGRGVYLSHALEFETNRASQELKDNYKGKLPQIVYQQPTLESVRPAYEAMLFDLDGTLTDTLSDIDKSLVNKLLYFLSQGVVIGIATSQSLDEVKKFVLDKVDGDKKQFLQSLILFTARGAQAWGFDQNKNPYLIYDRSQTDLNDQQRQLIRQVVNQALGSLAGDTDVTDRQAQITIRLKKDKDKRDLVNATLNQLIANNNLSFQTECVGNSTIHVVMHGIDKGTAKDYFLNQIIPQRLNHQTDVSKLLVVGDRFQEGGSDRPMLVQGARVVSVGGKDKSVPAGVEIYPHHGWKGTNQLLGEIINKSGRTMVTLPSVIIGFVGLSDFWQRLNDAGQGLYDVLKEPLLYLGIITLGLGFMFLAVTSGIKYYKTYRIYKELKQMVTFLDGKDSRRLFKAISGYTTWKKIQHIEPYQLFIDILPDLSKQTQDRRLIEVANAAARLKKSKIEPRHLFKYTLGPISSKTSDEKQFSKGLSIAERFAVSLRDKRYDYHQLLKDIMPSLTKTTRSLEELNEAMLLGVTLVRSGRNPTFALVNILPEVAALTKTISDYRLGIYALQQLCLEGFEPTKYLIRELIKHGQPQKIDQALTNWQEIRRKFKTGEVLFNPKNELYVNIEYTTFRELVDRTLKQSRKYSFREYQQILSNFNQNNKRVHLRRTEKAEIKFAAYEAFRFRQFVLEAKKQADKMGRKVWVVPNLSYGRFAVSPIVKDLIADDVEIHPARIGSSESHENPTVLNADLFNANLYERIMNEQPVIIVVDGTKHHIARNNGGKDSRYPDAYQGYRNMIIAVNDIISSSQERVFKYLVKREKGFEGFMRKIRKKSDYRTLRRRLLRLHKPDAKVKRQLYDVEFWNPGRREIILREDREKIGTVRPISPSQINQPTLIFVSSVMFDEDIPVFIRDWINHDKKVHHMPAYFDDTSHIQNIIFNVDSSGINLSDEIYLNIRREYKRIKSIYRPSFNLPVKPLNLAKLPYKAVISDLDGTLSNTLEDVSKPVIEKLVYLLGLGIQVAIITTQSYKEVEKYLLAQVPAKHKALLANLSIYAATGSQGFGFDKNGNPLSEPLYDTSDVKLSDRQMGIWRDIIKEVLKEYALDKEVKNKKGDVIATPAKIIDAGSQIIIRLKERGFLRRDITKRIRLALNREQLPITLKEIGGTSIRMTLRGIDKSIAVNYHLTQVCKAQFGVEPKPAEVLILGNSFDEEGDDRDMMVKGARVFSVGHKPLLHHLRAGINFYPEHGWEGSDQLLAEFINAMSVKVEEAKKQAPQQVMKLNSFNYLPFLATGGLFENLDPFSSWLIGCITGIVITLLIFKKEIFGSKEQEKTQPSIATPQLSLPRRKQKDFNLITKGIKEKYPGIKVGIIGATAPTKGYSSNLGVELGRKLRTYLGDSGFIFTGGVPGVGVDVYQGAVEASNGQGDRFFVLLPEGMLAGREYKDISPTKQVKTANFGEDMFERRIGMGKVSDVLIVLNGRAGTLHEAVSALENGKKIIVLNYGGAGSLLYQAKVNGIMPVLLTREGFKQEHLDNIIVSDIGNIGEVLSAVTGIAAPKREIQPARIFTAIEIKKIFQDAVKVPSDEDIISVVDENASSRWYSAVRRTIQTTLQRPITVYYPGAGRDIIHPLIATDAGRFIFVDINAANIPASYAIDKICFDINRIGGRVKQKEKIGPNEYSIKFTFNGKERTLLYYLGINAAKDNELPQIVKEGFDIYVEKNLVSGYSNISSNLVLPPAIKYLREGGFLLTDYSLRKQEIDPRLQHIAREWVREGGKSYGETLKYLTYFAKPNSPSSIEDGKESIIDNSIKIDSQQEKSPSEISTGSSKHEVSKEKIVISNEDIEKSKKEASSPVNSDVTTNPGGIDLTKIELTLKDERFVSSLNPADLKILLAARALKEGQDSLAVLYVHEVRLILKDNILAEKDITQKALLQNLLLQLEQKELLSSEAIEFCHIFQGQEVFPGERLAVSRIK